ncbi:MAG: hypothetical protein Q4A84_10735 [Neisseria sp.]|uniref:hypothetical protein n=1 Tax=Neisseria sp. TaxID=192066 RepID=UPI0026DC641A|nr:hypothetical protein [Neisseria sp.]MDO4642154.1 hypothetical protein [Neisseria sp.]
MDSDNFFYPTPVPMVDLGGSPYLCLNAPMVEAKRGPLFGVAASHVIANFTDENGMSVLSPHSNARQLAQQHAAMFEEFRRDVQELVRQSPEKFEYIFKRIDKTISENRRLDLNPLEQQNQPQYAQTAPALGLSDMPEKARQLCEECKTHLVDFYKEHGIAYNETDADKTAAAIGVAAYRERVPYVQALHIREDGLLSVGHKSPQGVLSYASLDSAQAAATPIEESVVQSKQAEQELAQRAQQREMALAEYHSQSRGRSIS